MLFPMYTCLFMYWYISSDSNKGLQIVVGSIARSSARATVERIQEGRSPGKNYAMTIDAFRVPVLGSGGWTDREQGTGRYPLFRRI